MRMVGLKPDMQKQVISREELRSIVSEAGEATRWTASTNVALYFRYGNRDGWRYHGAT